VTFFYAGRIVFLGTIIFSCGKKKNLLQENKILIQEKKYSKEKSFLST